MVRLSKNTGKEHPTSLILPVDLHAQVKRECLRRGEMPMATFIKMVLADYFNPNPALRKPKKKPKKIVEPQPPAA